MGPPETGGGEEELMNYLLQLEGTEWELLVLHEIFTGLPQVKKRTTQQCFHKDKFVQFKIYLYLR